MNIHPTSAPTTSGATARFGRKILLATLGGGVVLAAAVSAGLWARSDSRAPVAPAAEGVAVEASVSAAVAPASGSRTPSYTVYIVGSSEQADAVWADINYGNPILAANNELPFRASVIVAGSDQEAAWVTAFLTSINHILAEQGLRQDTIVDLRGN